MRSNISQRRTLQNVPLAVGSFPRGKWQQYDEKIAAEWANPQIEALLSESAIGVNPSLVAHREHSHGDRGHSH